MCMTVAEVSTTLNAAKQTSGIFKASQSPGFPRLHPLTHHVLVETAAAPSHVVFYELLTSRKKKDGEIQLSGTFLQGYSSQVQPVN